MTPFAPRPTTFLGVESHRGYSLKLFSIMYGEKPYCRDEFDAGFALALEALPQPAVTAGRPGAGFVILHQGKTGHYLILCRWDNENELPTKVFVTDENGWRPATGESFCVWDLVVMWREREAYVGTVLGGKSVADYLSLTTR
jgi:hypothetical protein